MSGRTTDLSSFAIASTPGSGSTKKQRNSKSTQYVGTATAGTRALLSQMLAFYVRVPVKLFRPTRVDYLLVPRAINPAIGSNMPWRFRTHSSMALLTHAVKKHGWRFIYDQVLPPLLANSVVGIILYTTYLTALPLFSNNDSDSFFGPANEVLTWRQTMAAGFIAGGAQSLAAAPIDAIFTRFSVSELLEDSLRDSDQTHKSLWRYGWEKLGSIGLRGVFAGYSLSFAKEATGFAVFFSTFEAVKQWSYKRLVTEYGAPLPKYVDRDSNPDKHASIREKPSAALYPASILGAGAAASVALQIVQHPLTRIQAVQLTILEAMDFAGSRHFREDYIEAYRRTFHQIKSQKTLSRHSWLSWLYRGLGRSVIVTVPSTSIGLFVFEIMRVRFMEEVEVYTDDDFEA
ncbi:mitochondrial carrier domain-containing protein [Lipomyces arxii]|uniref:mitochondrial carrier domain-containing protein n=1 Tax=Lipomyces arxii TaxID=56418 RepID=UPI0034CDE3FF